jgi:Leucine-rich repeat (LRR) protein
LAKKLKAHRYWELGYGAKRRAMTLTPQMIAQHQHQQAEAEEVEVEPTKDDKALDEEIRMLFAEATASVAFPSSKESKDLNKRRKMMEKVKNEVSTAVSEGKTEISFRKRGLDNTHVPKNMGKYMKEVKKLVLSDNKLFFFPMAILDMINLHTLELKNNALTHLPKEITRLTNLKKFDIENNQLTSLPGARLLSHARVLDRLAHAGLLNLSSSCVSPAR